MRLPLLAPVHGWWLALSREQAHGLLERLKRDGSGVDLEEPAVLGASPDSPTRL